MAVTLNQVKPCKRGHDLTAPGALGAQGKCKECAKIRAVGESGTGNPIEPDPVEGGNVRLIERGAGEKPLAIYDRPKNPRPPQLGEPPDDGVRYVSHFVNCPDAPAWRKR